MTRRRRRTVSAPATRAQCSQRHGTGRMTPHPHTVQHLHGTPLVRRSRWSCSPMGLPWQQSAWWEHVPLVDAQSQNPRCARVNPRYEASPSPSAASDAAAAERATTATTTTHNPGDTEKAGIVKRLRPEDWLLARCRCFRYSIKTGQVNFYKAVHCTMFHTLAWATRAGTRAGCRRAGTTPCGSRRRSSRSSRRLPFDQACGS